MRSQDVALVLSVQHTGTWFAVEAFRPWFPRVREIPFMLEEELRDGHAHAMREPRYDCPMDAPTLGMTHLPIGRFPELYLHPPMGTFERRWFENLANARSLPVQELLRLCNFFPAVVPVRDPLAAILTREARHPQFRHFYLVDGFVALATEFARHPNVRFLPVDLPMEEPVRLSLLEGLVRHLGRDPEEHGEHLRTVARDWTPRNTTPGNRFVDAYRARDLQAVLDALGPKRAEWDYAVNMMAVILPFLASVGYRREDFIW